MPRKKCLSAPTGGMPLNMPRIRANSRLMQTHETVVDLMSGRATEKTLQDAFHFGLFGVDFGSKFRKPYECHLEDDIIYSDSEEYTDDYRPLHPHPRIRQLTVEEAEKHAEELLEEEERQKDRAENKRLKRLRKKERKRLEKENATDTLPPNSGEEPEEIKSSEIQEENITERSSNSTVADETVVTAVEPLIAVKQVDLNQNIKTKKGKKKKPSVRPEEKRPQVREEKAEVVEEQWKGDHFIVKEEMAPGKSKSSENKGEDIFEGSKEAKETNVPGPGPSLNETGATALEESHGTHDDDDDDDDDDGGGGGDDVRVKKELDRKLQDFNRKMSAASTAKRQLDHNHTQQRKGKKKGSSAMKQPRETRHVMEDRVGVQEKQQEADNIIQEKREDVEDLAKKSTELAYIGNRFAACGRLEEAVKYFTDAIKCNPKEFKLFGNRSFCYERMQEYERALTDAEVALSMEPNWRKGLFRKGKALCGLKRYYDAALIYEEVLKQDSSCTEAAQELKKVQAMQLMEMGFTWEQSMSALINHTFEEALEALFGFEGKPVGEVTLDGHASNGNTDQPTGEKMQKEDWVVLGGQRRKAPGAKDQTRPQSQSPTPLPRNGARPELFPVWVGSVVSAITEAKLKSVFSRVGTVYSIKMLDNECAFVHYTKKEDCEKAIQLLNGMACEGAILSVRYPNKIYHNLGVSKTAVTEPIVRPPPPSSSTGGRFGQIH